MSECPMPDWLIKPPGRDFVVFTAAWLGAAYYLGHERGALVGNICWFGLAFLYFGLMSEKSVLWMVSREQRKNTELVDGLRKAMGFLGGMNAGMAVLSALFLTALGDGSTGLFQQANERRVLFIGFAVGHLSQALFQRFNPPGILWYIYWIDLAMAAANGYCGWAAQ